MLALQQPANGSAVAPRQSQDYSNSSQQLEQQQQQQQQHQLQLQLQQQQLQQQQQQQQNTTPLIQIQSLNESRNGSFSMHLHGRQQPQAPMQQQQQQRGIGPLDKPGSPWMVADFPPLPSRTGQSVSSQGLLGAQSFNSVHPLQQQHIARPHSASGSFQQPQQGQMHLLQQQQQQQQLQQQHHHHHHQLSHFQGIESAQGLNSHLGSPNAPSLLESPAHSHAPHFQGLNQDSPLSFEHGSWSDHSKGQHPMDMFHIASPPHTPSGAMARSPSSYSAFGMNNNSNIKRPPLWPMDRPPMLPFPRQPLTPSQSSKAANLQHIPCKFFKSGACTAGKNCLFSHSRDPPSENFVCKYFLKGNCKFGAKCSLSHSFLALDRKTSALMPGGGGSLGRNNRLERRASSGAILNNPWAPEPLSPPYTSSLSQQQALQFNNNNNNSNVEFTMGGRSPNQQGFFKPALNKASSDGLRNAVYMTPPTEVGNGSGGPRSPYSEDDNMNADANGNERAVHPLSLLESRVRQHLAAPLPIRQRSLPDIFRLTPLSHDGPSMGGTSPFHQPGNKGLFLSVSSCESEVTPSSPLRLHSIPELHDLYNNHGQNNHLGHTSLPRRSSSAHFHSVVQDDDDDDDHHNDLDGDEFSDSEGSDQGFLPSSLNDLLTTHERQRRQSRQDDVDPRLNMLPSPASGSLRGDKDEDDARFGYGALSSVPGVSQQTDFRPQFQSRFTYDGSNHEASVSPLAMLIPNNQMAMAPYPFQDPSSYETVEDLSYQRQHPHYHQQPQPQQLRGLSNDQGPHYKERNLTPDPFCPFPNDAEEVQFVMDDDVVASSAGTGRAHTSAGGGRGGQSITAAQRDHDKRAGLFVDDAARATAVASKELNRAVGSHTTIQSGRQQQPQGTLTPVSLNSREDDTAEGAGAAVSSVAMDFSALTISSKSSISSGAELFDLSGSTASAPTSYAGIARSQKSSF